MKMLQLVLFCLTVSAATTELPNIVILLADDLGIGDVGCFGNTTLRTPNIDRIAKEGVKLTHHLAAASVCTPSRAALLAGRYPIRMGMAPTHSIRVNTFSSSVSGMPVSEMTLAELVKKKGYETAFMGKWHLGLHSSNVKDFAFHPLNQGFDYFYGLPLTNFKDYGDRGEKMVLNHVPYFNEICLSTALAFVLPLLLLQKKGIIGWKTAATIGLMLLVPLFYFWWVWMNFKMINSILMRNHEIIEQPIKLSGFTDRIVKEGVQYLKNRNKNTENQKPFLLVMSWIQVHTAYHATRLKGKSSHGPYGDEVEELDWSIGQILDALQTHGMKNNTFVYFTSDNGGHVEGIGIDGNREGGYNGIYRGGKMQGGMDGGIRVPTAMMWPGVITTGSVINQPTSLMDIYPTIADIIGESIPTDTTIDGISLKPVWSGNKLTKWHKFLFHYCGDVIHASRYTPYQDSKDIWKVHFATPNWHPGTQGCGYHCTCYGNKVTQHDPPLLYNIGRDPGEKQLCTDKKICPPLKSAEEQDAVIEIIVKATEEHRAKVNRNVPNMYALYKMLPRPWLQMCCNFPYCNCSEK